MAINGAICFPYTVDSNDGSNPLTVCNNIALMVGSNCPMVCKLQTGLYVYTNQPLTGFYQRYVAANNGVRKKMFS